MTDQIAMTCKSLCKVTLLVSRNPKIILPDCTECMNIVRTGNIVIIVCL